MLLRIIFQNNIFHVKITEIDKIVQCSKLYIDDYKLRLSSDSVLILEANKILLSKKGNEGFNSCSITTTTKTILTSEQIRPRIKRTEKSQKKTTSSEKEANEDMLR